MKRRLSIEKLDQRLCMAFGDIDTSFGVDGQVTVAYDTFGNQWDRPIGFFEDEAGYSLPLITQLVSGYLFSLAKLNSVGDLDAGHGATKRFQRL